MPLEIEGTPSRTGQSTDTAKASGARLELRNLSKAFGGVRAVDDISLDVRSVADVPSHKRNIGMVFQSYSLFPHMTVAENVAFPLRMRTKLSRQEARTRLGETLALVQLGHLAER